MKNFKKKFEEVLRFYPWVAYRGAPPRDALKSPKNARYGGMCFVYSFAVML